jgi:aminopeptidase-like protein
VGDGGPFTYKRSRRHDAEIDRTVERVLKQSGKPYSIVDFFPMGSDERQFCSPGFDLPVASLMRTMYYKFPQYHTSADDLTLVKGAHLLESVTMYARVIEELERSATYRTLVPYGEPQLGKRGLYEHIGGARDRDEAKKALMWVLNFSDGRHSLLDIADRAQIELPIIEQAAQTLEKQGLLEVVS